MHYPINALMHGSHGLSARRAWRTLSSRPEGPKAGPKGLSLEVGARRAPRLLVVHISWFGIPNKRAGSHKGLFSHGLVHQYALQWDAFSCGSPFVGPPCGRGMGTPCWDLTHTLVGSASGSSMASLSGRGSRKAGTENQGYNSNV